MNWGYSSRSEPFRARAESGEALGMVWILAGVQERGSSSARMPTHAIGPHEWGTHCGGILMCGPPALSELNSFAITSMKNGPKRVRCISLLCDVAVELDSSIHGW